MKQYSLPYSYDICVVDIGSPRLGNIGWCFIDSSNNAKYTGEDLDTLIVKISEYLPKCGLIMGLEAPLFVPLRDDIIKATKGRNGEGSRPWSAGAGAQVLAMNLPIMTYIFKKIQKEIPSVDIAINENSFSAAPNQIMIFEALVSGSDKGKSHIDDAQIMAEYCVPYSQIKSLPPSILKDEDGTDYFNLVASSLMRCGIIDNTELLACSSPIYRPSVKQNE